MPRNFIDENPAIDGPDYVALVIEWENDLPAETHAGSDSVDQASMDSFPASDPPIATPRKPWKLIAVGAAAVGALLSFVVGRVRRH